jgi:DNA polymerase III subunit delta
MAQVSPQEMLARLGKGKAVAAVLLLGEEPYLRDACRAQLIEKFVPEAARTWAVSRYSADRGETQEALEQAQSLPMLAPKQVVFLEDVDAVEKLGEKNREAAIAQLEEYLQNPAPFTTLVLEAGGLDQRMKLAKLLMEKALVVSVALAEDAGQRQEAAVGLAKSMAEEQGVKFESGAAEDLAESVAADLMRLKTEIDKLATFAGQRKFISRQDVSVMVVSEKTTTVWELADLLATRKAAKALEFLDRLLRDGEEPLPMLGAITWLYRKLIEASELRGISNGWQAARALGMRPEQAELALHSARKISKPRLLNGLRALQKADDQLKRGEDARTIMEFLVAELVSAEPAKAAGR